ncbi:hypothetical protein H7H82_05540 [Mycobacterium heidelbergense]|uniref:hypothetical protein n=1 Tax=Mycobacterium heidelbergense TaxID=53376 RepID=UPI001153965F|nr:hypothetical protein [Mycobacterium heidelbergense]MCV7050066.1 hypothetical protein [Mycobacterium heidelbergense]BBZ51752.1 hypothetical protein MHEI_34690 [Mycobacterium heidelbergense]
MGPQIEVHREVIVAGRSGGAVATSAACRMGVGGEALFVSKHKSVHYSLASNWITAEIAILGVTVNADRLVTDK